MRLIGPSHLILLLSVAGGCHRGAAAIIPVFLEIVVEEDAGMRLSAIPIRIDGEAAGRTNGDGTLRVPVFRQPGRVLRVTHDCPAGHHAPNPGVSVRVRRYELTQSEALRIKLRCRPLSRLAAFVVRAKGGAALPVLLNGERVATTNAAGIAHFSRSAPPGTEYRVEVDAREHPALLPRSAAMLVRLPDSSELFVIAPTFQSSNRRNKAGARRRRIIKIE